MLGIYFSGTGNTKHCVTKLSKLVDQSARVMSIEDKQVIEEIKKNKVIILGYPIQYSNAPIIIKNFIKANSLLWKNKKVLCLATMDAFSGDGAGCGARLLKKYGTIIIGGLHIKMPDSVCDSKLLKKSKEENRKIINQADIKIETVANNIKKGRYPKEGINFFYHLAGLFGQRLWFFNKTRHYYDKVKISDKCIGCGTCEKLCPMNNIVVNNGRAVANNKCTLCYRCVSHCPEQAITVIGKKVYQQYQFEKYDTEKCE